MADGTWKLPIDTVQAIWHGYFPTLLESLWKPRDPSSPPSKYPPVTPDVLKGASTLGTWFETAFKTEAGNAKFKQFLPEKPMWLTAMDGLNATYLVHDRGLVLPLHEDAEAPTTGIEDKTNAELEQMLHEHLQVLFGSSTQAPRWCVRGTQMEMLRGAIALATAEIWIDQASSGQRLSVDPNDFRTRIQTIYDDGATRVYGQAGASERQLSLSGWLHLDQQEHMVVGTSTPTRYYNVEAGAGYFSPNGYTTFLPVPPVLKAVMEETPPPGIAPRNLIVFNDCSLAAESAPSLYDYATVTTCNRRHGGHMGGKPSTPP